MTHLRVRRIVIVYELGIFASEQTFSQVVVVVIADRHVRLTEATRVCDSLVSDKFLCHAYLRVHKLFIANRHV